MLDKRQKLWPVQIRMQIKRTCLYTLAPSSFFRKEFPRPAVAESHISGGGRCVIMANLLRCYRHSGLVMYFSTLPAPSASAPCILAILTHLRVRVKICILTHPHENPPEGRASGGGVWFCRRDRNQQNSGKRMGTCCSSVLPSIL